VWLGEFRTEFTAKHAKSAKKKRFHPLRASPAPPRRGRCALFAVQNNHTKGGDYRYLPCGFIRFQVPIPKPKKS
jgi:hypothetical protein